MNDFIKIRQSFDQTTSPELYLTSMLGQRISLQLNADTTVDLSRLPPGIYQLIMKDGANTYYARIVKR